MKCLLLLACIAVEVASKCDVYIDFGSSGAKLYVNPPDGTGYESKPKDQGGCFGAIANNELGHSCSLPQYVTDLKNEINKVAGCDASNKPTIKKVLATAGNRFYSINNKAGWEKFSKELAKQDFLPAKPDCETIPGTQEAWLENMFVDPADGAIGVGGASMQISIPGSKLDPGYKNADFIGCQFDGCKAACVNDFFFYDPCTPAYPSGGPPAMNYYTWVGQGEDSEYTAANPGPIGETVKHLLGGANVMRTGWNKYCKGTLNVAMMAFKGDASQGDAYNAGGSLDNPGSTLAKAVHKCMEKDTLWKKFVAKVASSVPDTYAPTLLSNVRRNAGKLAQLPKTDLERHKSTGMWLGGKEQDMMGDFVHWAKNKFLPDLERDDKKEGPVIDKLFSEIGKGCAPSWHNQGELFPMDFAVCKDEANADEVRALAQLGCLGKMFTAGILTTLFSGAKLTQMLAKENTNGDYMESYIKGNTADMFATFQGKFSSSSSFADLERDLKTLAELVEA